MCGVPDIPDGHAPDVGGRRPHRRQRQPLRQDHDRHREEQQFQHAAKRSLLRLNIVRIQPGRFCSNGLADRKQGQVEISLNQ